MEALNQRIGLAAVWVCGTVVVFRASCVTCRGRESATRNGGGGGLPGAVDSRDGRFFCVVRRGGVGGMGCRSFDGRVGCDEFTVGVGSFLARAHVARDREAQGRRGIGEFGAA